MEPVQKKNTLTLAEMKRLIDRKDFAELVRIARESRDTITLALFFTGCSYGGLPDGGHKRWGVPDEAAQTARRRFCELAGKNDRDWFRMYHGDPDRLAPMPA